MAFLDQYQLAQDPDFLGRVAVATVKAAVAVMAEAEPTPERVKYAGIVLRNPHGAAQQMALAVVTNGAVTAESNDGDIEFTVNSVYQAMADATAG